MSNEQMLSVQDLRVHFKMRDKVVKAVDGVSFDIHPGEVIGLVGESGSGKSVTSLSVLGLLPQPPAFYPSGKVMLGDEDLLKANKARLREVRGNEISMIFQDPLSSLNPFLRVGDQLMETLITHKKASSSDAKKLVIEMLGRVGIPSPDKRFSQYPHEFSGGMRQRVMIAMALLCRPKLLIADEPTTALDVTIQAQILELMKEINRDLNTSILLITHDLGVVAGMADRILVMYAGRIVERGTAKDIFHSPQHPYTKGLLGSLPKLDEALTESLQAIPGLPPDLGDLPEGCPFAPRCGQAVDRCTQAYPDVVEFASGQKASCFEVSP